MSSFLANIAARHTTPVSPVQPRLPGRFETQGLSSTHESEDLYAYNGYTASPGQPAPVEPQHNPAHHSVDIESGSKKTFAANISDLPSIQQEDNTDTPHLYASVSQTIVKNEGRETLVQSLPEMNDQPVSAPYYKQETNKADHPKSNQPREKDHSFAEKKAAANGSLHYYDQSSYLPDIQPVAKEFTMPFVQSGTAQSLIKVSIGRIDVRAATTPVPARPNSIPAQTSRMSLDDYFNKKKNA